ncbi:MAG: NAD(P)/FAD-dependent oxidoreductase [Anaerolineaceae bacterium]|nr:NAD(P)/FAD-dependent oxidoreductase [Anaerolineaceae bacterium]
MNPTAVHNFDVIVIGAGIAGCTAATLYGRAGLTVALIERQPDNHAYKKLCTHYIQASAKPTLDRLGVSERIEAVGGVRNGMAIWTKSGWIRPSADPRYPPHGYSLRREKLDPLLRQLATETPGVTFFNGHAWRELLWDSQGRISGVLTSEQKSKQTHRFNGRLTVAADGHYSKTAELLKLRGRSWVNGRFGYFAYYRHLPLPTGPMAQIWFKQPDVAYAFPNDDAITLIAYMPSLDKLPAFKPDPHAALEQHFAALPDAPDMASAERLSPALGMLKGEFHWRPAAVPGLALVGDAAASTDPLWGCGCGWAFESAAWLVDATAEMLLKNGDVVKGLTQYKKLHWRRLAGHNWYNGGFASGRNFYPHEQLILAAAAKDEQCARHVLAFAARHVGIGRLHSPLNFFRSLWINLRQR